MVTVTKSLSMETALGELTIEVFVDGAALTDESVEISWRSIAPALPPGMSVDTCRVILIKVDSGSSLCHVRYIANLHAKSIGSACTGEALEAMEWEEENRTVVVGTEDSEALVARMPWAAGALNAVIATYTSQALKIDTGDVHHPKPVSFHIVIAENALPEPSEASAWFAVDIPHEQVLAMF